jgi:hypothetical protein
MALFLLTVMARAGAARQEASLPLYCSRAVPSDTLDVEGVVNQAIRQ